MLEVESLADIVTVGDVTRHHARIRPDRVAIHFEGRHTTFGELDRRERIYGIAEKLPKQASAAQGRRLAPPEPRAKAAAKR